MTTPYAPPKTQQPERAEHEYPVSIPGVSASIVVTTQGPGGKSDILVNGEPAEKKSFGKRMIPKDDGSLVVARLSEQLTGLVLNVEKVNYPIGPRVSTLLGVLVLLPIALVAVGGLIGGLFGGGGLVINRKIAHSGLSDPKKIAAMIGVSAIALLIVLTLATAVQVAATK